MGLDYKTAGVDKEAGYRQVQLMKNMVASTHTAGVLTELGGFSGVFQPDLQGMKNPVLVSGTDGVGTKLILAQELGIHNTIGIDAVAMCVNDVLCQGAKPLFFLDYIATGKNVPEKMAEIVEGVVEGCKQSNMALIGGETAEMPGMYGQDEYDIAGFVVGIADKDQLITGQAIKAGDLVLGLPSSGVHSNGFSLVRAILKSVNVAFSDHVEGLEKSVGETLLEPTRIYVKEIQALLDKISIHGISHITGGGLEENVPRMLPEGLGIQIDSKAIPRQPIFDKLQEWGGIESQEMYGTFNMGVGMVLAIDPQDLELAKAILTELGTTPMELGYVTDQMQGVQVLC